MVSSGYHFSCLGFLYELLWYKFNLADFMLTRIEYLDFTLNDCSCLKQRAAWRLSDPVVRRLGQKSFCLTGRNPKKPRPLTTTLAFFSCPPTTMSDEPKENVDTATTDDAPPAVESEEAVAPEEESTATFAPVVRWRRRHGSGLAAAGRRDD
jgi:hypothetical protein